MRGLVFEAQALSNLEVVTGTLTMHKDLPLEHELRCDVMMATWNDKIVSGGRRPEFRPTVDSRRSICPGGSPS